MAVAALEAKRLLEVAEEDHAAVMRLWAHRRKELTSGRTRVANRLHGIILELVPGGYAGEIYASKLADLLEDFQPVGAVAAARKELAEELLGDLGRLDAQLGELQERLAAVVAASGSTTTTRIFGVGPVVAPSLSASPGTYAAPPTRTTSPLTRALPRSKFPLGRRRSTGCRCGAAAS